MTPEQWLEKYNNTMRRHDSESTDLADMREWAKYPKADELRPATPKDVRQDAVFYYPDCDPPWWCVVAEVRCPDDDFKAFVADDGCRHGLHGAFVKREPPHA